MHRRGEFAEFLPARRARVRPEDLGLTTAGRRRVAGLRRDEAARRAGVSVEYSTRLEQGRGGRPSDEVLDALATGDGERFPFGALEGAGGRHDRSIVTFFLLDCVGLGTDLAWLARRVASRHLDPHVTWRGEWDDVANAIDALLHRRLHGKAVLDIATSRPPSRAPSR